MKEFDKCVVKRDCCDELNCVTGDWQFTTDSTCLSKKSEEIESSKFSLEEKIQLVQQFYSKLSSSSEVFDETGMIVVEKKTPDEISTIVNKYKSEFPKLVMKLERKYDHIKFDIVVDKMKEEQEL